MLSLSLWSHAAGRQHPRPGLPTPGVGVRGAPGPGLPGPRRAWTDRAAFSVSINCGSFPGPFTDSQFSREVAGRQ